MIFAAALTLCMMSSAVPKVVGDKPTIKIGVITETSGVNAEPAQEALQGIKLYLQQNHNELAGANVELIIESDESNPTAGLLKFEKLAGTDKANLILGPLLAHVASRVALVVDKYKVPFLLPVSAADDLTKRKHPHWLLRTNQAASQGQQVLGDYLFKAMHYKRIVLMGQDYPFCAESLGGLQKTFEDAGGQVVQKIWLPTGERNFAPYFQSVRKDADALYVCVLTGLAAPCLKQYQESGLHVPLVVNGTGCEEAALRHLTEVPVGTLSSENYSSTLENQVNKNFVADYRAKYNVYPDHFAECGYTCMMIIDKALRQVQGHLDDPERLLAALKSVELSESPRGPIKFDSYGNPIQNYYIRRLEKVNGRFENVVIHTVPKVSQFWTYKPEEYLTWPPYSKEFPLCRFCSEPKGL
jgi:branched-chain amino acid transport system substrate-binding protein